MVLSRRRKLTPESLAGPHTASTNSFFAFGLAALHRKEPPARADEVVAQGLKRDDRPDALQPVGVAGEATAHPDDGAGALGKRPVEER